MPSTPEGEKILVGGDLNMLCCYRFRLEVRVSDDWWELLLEQPAK